MANDRKDTIELTKEEYAKFQRHQKSQENLRNSAKRRRIRDKLLVEKALANGLSVNELEIDETIAKMSS